MNRDEAKIVLEVLKNGWPQSFRGMGPDEIRSTINLWAEMFKDDPVTLVAAAVKAILVGERREFAPPIGVVKAKMQDLLEPERMSEMEAWGYVQKALRSGCSMSRTSRRFVNGVLDDRTSAQRSFDALPPIVQRVVGSPEMLASWGEVPKDQIV